MLGRIRRTGRQLLSSEMLGRIRRTGAATFEFRNAWQNSPYWGGNFLVEHVY
jgi:hypothetical protein